MPKSGRRFVTVPRSPSAIAHIRLPIIATTAVRSWQTFQPDVVDVELCSGRSIADDTQPCAAGKLRIRVGLDPTGDGDLSPLDVLTVINYLNSYGPGPVPSAAGPTRGEGERSELDRLLPPTGEPTDDTVAAITVDFAQGQKRLSPPFQERDFEEHELEEVFAAIAPDVA